MGYGFKAGYSGMVVSGGSLKVNAEAGATVSVTKDGRTKTKTAGLDGVAFFTGLTSGDWLITMTDGERITQKTVTIDADFEVIITFFSATINVTYPAGSVCTATDGVTTFTAPDTSGSWACVVPNTGTWTFAVAGKGWTDSVEIAKDGDTVSVDLTAHWYYRDGDTRDAITGGWQQTKYYSLNAGTVSFISSAIALVANTNCGATVVTTGKVTIAEDTLCAEVGLSSGSGQVYVGVCDGISNISPMTQACVEMQAGVVNVVRLDVSGLKGQTVNVFVLFIARASGGVVVGRVYGE